jgi:conjugative relaxase-like TrwC/TraI family protein
MISCSAISSGAGAAGYFSDSFAKDGESTKGAENYYLDGKAEMTWQGKGAEFAGLSDKAVTSQALTDVLDGKLTNPATGEIQDLSTASKGHRSGWDFTISPPKSVSTVALVGGDDRVVDAHLAASQAAMEWIERNGAQYRASSGGEVETHASGNLIWATTTHQTNRLDEPNLHNHNVIANATWDEKAETWRSLTNDEIFRIRQMGDFVYKTELSNKLEELGYQVTREKNGNFEIDGASKFNKAFSSRSESQKEAVEANLRAKGIDPATASYEQRNQAKLETRPEKGELTLAQAKEGWKETESRVGANFEALVADAKARARDPEMLQTGNERQDTATKAVGMAVAHLSERCERLSISA